MKAELPCDEGYDGAPGPIINLQPYTEPWDPLDPDANFRREVAASSLVDPMPTLEGMSRNLGIPVGAIAGYVLAKWAASGSEGLMEAGPLVVRQMADLVREAESAGTDAARLEAYHALSRIVSWLAFPLDHEDWQPGR